MGRVLFVGVYNGFIPLSVISKINMNKDDRCFMKSLWYFGLNVQVNITAQIIFVVATFP